MGLAALAFCSVLTVFAAVIAGQFGPMSDGGTWYAGLFKPDWIPPPALFGIVWPILYITIAIAGWLVFRAAANTSARMFWLLQLVLNALWSPIFFGLQSPCVALACIWLLWVVIGGFFATAHRHSWLASLLIIPYWVWISIAVALNQEIVRLNPLV